MYPRPDSVLMPRLAAMHLSVLKIPCGGLFARNSDGSGSSVLCSCLSPSLDIRAPLTATAGRPPRPWQGFHRLRATSAWRDRAWLPLPAPLRRTPVRAAPCWPPRGPVLARRGATLCLPPPSGPSRDQNPQRPRSALQPLQYPLAGRSFHGRTFGVAYSPSLCFALCQAVGLWQMRRLRSSSDDFGPTHWENIVLRARLSNPIALWFLCHTVSH